MKTLFSVLSVLLVMAGLFTVIGDQTNLGIAFLAIGMTGIGVAAYNRRQ